MKTQNKESKYNTTVEALVALIITPLVLVFNLIALVLVLALLASPLILIGYFISKL